MRLARSWAPFPTFDLTSSYCPDLLDAWDWQGKIRKKIDFEFLIIVSFSSSPNLVFLSPSVVSGDGSMSVRIGHEMSHAWFGCSIGPKDWTEEWLTEGFATYCEDVIEAIALEVKVHTKAELYLT